MRQERLGLAHAPLLAAIHERIASQRSSERTHTGLDRGLVSGSGASAALNMPTTRPPFAALVAVQHAAPPALKLSSLNLTP
ncbi:hypothetical protein [Candidatus Chloroploca sp. Khr17]|uniref:hypothetical protein n=1 Tax=Candidatus Chloroploca sp. Khr17 TaxID=2496869 RepID=UPI00101BED34|nr:hypothetical protein [Candidatus Chloroploca sp. Khr17]